MVAGQRKTGFKRLERLAGPSPLLPSITTWSGCAKADGGDRLMAKVPAFARPFPAAGGSPGWICERRLPRSPRTGASNVRRRNRRDRFGALNGFLDVRYGARDAPPAPSLSWDAFDENDQACGRGWATIGTAGHLVGYVYIHKGDDSALSANSTEFFNSLLEPALALVHHVWQEQANRGEKDQHARYNDLDRYEPRQPAEYGR